MATLSYVAQRPSLDDVQPRRGNVGAPATKSALNVDVRGDRLGEFFVGRRHDEHRAYKAITHF